MALSARGTMIGALAAVLLGACAQQPPVVDAPSLPAPFTPKLIEPLPDPGAGLPGKAMTMDAYKALVAQEVSAGTAAVYAEPVPDMLKSIVVLEITIDRAGNPIDVQVYRSNGYKGLETRALESIVRAAPFPPPSPALLRGEGELTFLETFLFRDDDYFRLRTLVRAPGF